MVSNAGDALDKMRYISLTDKEALGKKTELDIRIKADKKAKTISITDSGIGMCPKHETLTFLETAENLEDFVHNFDSKRRMESQWPLRPPP